MAELSITQMTEAYNALAARCAADKLGILWAHHHTSPFGTRATAQRQLDKLVEAIAEATGETKEDVAAGYGAIISQEPVPSGVESAMEEAVEAVDVVVAGARRREAARAEPDPGTRTEIAVSHNGEPVAHIAIGTGEFPTDITARLEANVSVTLRRIG